MSANGQPGINRTWLRLGQKQQAVAGTKPSSAAPASKVGFRQQRTFRGFQHLISEQADLGRLQNDGFPPASGR